jgi:hypothetical protein
MIPIRNSSVNTMVDTISKPYIYSVNTTSLLSNPDDFPPYSLTEKAITINKFYLIDNDVYYKNLN